MAFPYETVTALVAAGEADMQAYLARCLSLLGVGRVLTATDGREALHLAAVADLVISDAAMPGFDGEALCRAVRAHEARVLIIGGAPTRRDAGTPGYLRKPFNARALKASVELLFAPPPSG